MSGELQPRVAPPAPPAAASPLAPAAALSLSAPPPRPVPPGLRCSALSLRSLNLWWFLRLRGRHQFFCLLSAPEPLPPAAGGGRGQRSGRSRGPALLGPPWAPRRESRFSSLCRGFARAPAVAVGGRGPGLFAGGSGAQGAASAMSLRRAVPAALPRSQGRAPGAQRPLDAPCPSLRRVLWGALPPAVTAGAGAVAGAQAAAGAFIFACHTQQRDEPRVLQEKHHYYLKSCWLSLLCPPLRSLQLFVSALVHCTYTNRMTVVFSKHNSTPCCNPPLCSV